MTGLREFCIVVLRRYGSFCAEFIPDAHGRDKKVSTSAMRPCHRYACASSVAGGDGSPSRPTPLDGVGSPPRRKAARSDRPPDAGLIQKSTRRHHRQPKEAGHSCPAFRFTLQVNCFDVLCASYVPQSAVILLICGYTFCAFFYVETPASGLPRLAQIVLNIRKTPLYPAEIMLYVWFVKNHLRPTFKRSFYENHPIFRHSTHRFSIFWNPPANFISPMKPSFSLCRQHEVFTSLERN